MKRIISFFLTIIMLLSSTGVIHGEEIKYIALGDSITEGYGLEDKGIAYPSVFAEKRQLSLTNAGVSGMTGNELLEYIKTDDNISQAQVITVSIGSNDLLQPLIEIIAKNIALDLSAVQGDKLVAIKTRILEIYDNGNGKTELQNIFNALTKELTGNEALYAAADNFANVEFPAIIAEIRSKNADARIFVTDIYNPYNNVTISVPLDSGVSAFVDLGVICQPYVDRINAAFSNPRDYIAVNISEIFATRLLTNVTKDIDFNDLDNVNLDPHPNFAGHAVIATLMANAYKSEFLYGDADSNGVLAANDSAKILQYVLDKGSVDMTKDELVKADVNGDGAITADDAAQVLQKVLVNTYTFAVE